MTTLEDFDPIADSGTLEAVTGVLRKRRNELPAAERGYERVVFDRSGKAETAAVKLTAGERFWGRGSHWVMVDIKPHTLTHDVAFHEPTGKIGFVATVTVRSQVKDSVEAARSEAGSVREQLEPAIHNAIKLQWHGEKHAQPDEPLSLHRVALQQAEQHVLALVGSDLIKHDWLSGEVLSASVAFDSETKRHYDQLRQYERGDEIDGVKVTGELSRAELEHRKTLQGIAHATNRFSFEAELERMQQQHEQEMRAREEKHQLELRNTRREMLSKYLEDANLRELELAFIDGSAETLDRVVRQLAANDRERNQQVAGILELLVNQDLIDKGDPIYRVVANAIVQQLDGRGSEPPAEIAEVATVDGVAETITHNVVGEDPKPDRRSESDWKP